MQSFTDYFKKETEDDKRLREFNDLDKLYNNVNTLIKNAESNYPELITPEIKEQLDILRERQGKLRLKVNTPFIDATSGRPGSIATEPVASIPVEPTGIRPDSVATEPTGIRPDSVATEPTGIRPDSKPDNPAQNITYGTMLLSSLAAGIHGGMSSSTQVLDNWASWLAEKTGGTHGGIFNELSQVYNSMAESARASGFNPNNSALEATAAYIAEGLGGAGVTIGEIMALGGGTSGFTLFGGMAGGGETIGINDMVKQSMAVVSNPGKHTEEDIEKSIDFLKEYPKELNIAGGVAKGAGQSYLLSKYLHLFSAAPMAERVAAGAAGFGGMSLYEELKKPEEQRDYKKIVADAILGGGLSLPGPKGKDYREYFYTNLKHDIVSKINTATMKMVDKDISKMDLQDILDKYPGNNPREQYARYKAYEKYGVKEQRTEQTDYDRKKQIGQSESDAANEQQENNYEDVEFSDVQQPLLKQGRNESKSLPGAKERKKLQPLSVIKSEKEEEVPSVAIGERNEPAADDTETLLNIAQGKGRNKTLEAVKYGLANRDKADEMKRAMDQIHDEFNEAMEIVKAENDPEKKTQLLQGIQQLTLNRQIAREAYEAATTTGGIGEAMKRGEFDNEITEAGLNKEDYRKPAKEVITDPSRVQEIKNSIAEGELILKTGKIHGRKLSTDELEAVRQAVKKSKAKIGIEVDETNPNPAQGEPTAPESTVSEEITAKPTTSTPTPNAPGKELWEMDLVEYAKGELRRVGKNELADQITRPEQVKSYAAQHQVEIKAALKRGDAVPENILAEYPELQTAKPEPSGKVQPFPERFYYMNQEEGALEVNPAEIKRKNIKFDGIDDVFFVMKSPDGDGYSITSLKTGLGMGRGKTIQKAIDEAQEIINRFGVDKVNQRIQSKSQIGESIKAAEAPIEEEQVKQTARVLENKKLGGIEIQFDEKPDQEIIDQLKQSGFKWSNRNKVWYRKGGADVKARATLIAQRANKGKGAVNGEGGTGIKQEAVQKSENVAGGRNTEIRGNEKGLSGESAGEKLPDKIVSDAEQSVGGGMPGDKISSPTVGMAGLKTAGSPEQVRSGDSDDRMVPEAVDGNNNAERGLQNKNYDLRGLPDIAFTKGQRTGINRRVEELLQKPIEELTADDLNTLRQYTGQGGLKSGTEFTHEALNQHYTPYTTIKAIYEMLDSSGFKFKNALEPAVGAGNFVGMAPDKNWTTIDLDKINHEVARRLYPEGTHYNISFENYRDKGFDLVISNVPFSEQRGEGALSNRPDIKALHDFYFLHSIDAVRDDGIIAFITSTGTMDKVDGSIRSELMDKADIVAAYRLPGGHFEETAHTSVITDLIILQKRPAGAEVSLEQLENNSAFVQLYRDGNLKLNSYYRKHPENILGELVVGKDKLHGGREIYNVEGVADLSKIIKFQYKPYNKQDAAKAEAKRADALPKKSHVFYKYTEDNKIEYRLSGSTGYDENIFIEDGQLYVATEQYMFDDIDQTVKIYNTAENTELKDKILELEFIKKLAEEYQYTGDMETRGIAIRAIENYRKHFNSVHPNKDKELKALFNNAKEGSYFLELSSFFDTNFMPNDVINQKTRYSGSGRAEANADSPLIDRAFAEENNRGLIDMSKSKLLSYDEIDKLLDTQYAIQSVIGDEVYIQNKILYYSGSIYEKIENLEKIHEDSRYYKKAQEQITELEKIKPVPKNLEDISFKGTESWIAPHLLKIGLRIGKGIDEKTGQIQYIFQYNKFYERYLNNNQLVTRKENETTYQYMRRVAEAEEEIQEIKDQLRKALLQKPEVLKTALYDYNSKFNTYVKPSYSQAVYLIKDVLNEINLHSKIKLRKNQIEWAIQALFEGKGVNAHDVGGGKTFASIVLARALKVRGIAKKPLFVVPSKTIIKWERDIKKLFPDAKVINLGKLVADKRTEALYGVANTNADFILISHEGFASIKLSQETELEYVNGLLRENMDDPDAKGRSKALLDEKIKQYKALISGSSRDSRQVFEKLGVDALIIDEAHNYKNIGIRSSLTKYGLGIGFGFNNEGTAIKSARSYDMRFKADWISRNNNGNNVFLLSATPTPNKPMEIFTMLRHLSPVIFKEFGINTDRDFADQFFKLGTIENIATGESSNVLLSIVNATELRSIIDRYIDKKSIESMDFIKKPAEKSNRVFLDPSADMIMVMDDLRRRQIEAVAPQSASVGDDTILSVYTSGRSASIDPRLYHSTHARVTVNERSFESDTDKLQHIIEFAKKNFDRNKDGGQLIFLDNPGHILVEAGKLPEDLHAEIKRELVALGFGAKQIAIINGKHLTNPDTGTENSVSGDKADERKQLIADKYNDGLIKVVIGSTQSMGEGMDLNVYTTDIIHADIPFTNAAYRQRNGRGIRSGNMNDNVNIHYLFTKGSFDNLSFNLVSNKKGWNEALWDKEVANEISVGEEMIGGSMPQHEQIMIEMETDPDIKLGMIIRYRLKHLAQEQGKVRENISSLKLRAEISQRSLADLNQQLSDREINLKNTVPDESIKDKAAREEKYIKSKAYKERLLESTKSSIEQMKDRMQRTQRDINDEQKELDRINTLLEDLRFSAFDEDGNLDIAKYRGIQEQMGQVNFMVNPVNIIKAIIPARVKKYFGEKIDSLKDKLNNTSLFLDFVPTTNIKDMIHQRAGARNAAFEFSRQLRDNLNELMLNDIALASETKPTKKNELTFKAALTMLLELRPEHQYTQGEQYLALGDGRQGNVTGFTLNEGFALIGQAINNQKGIYKTILEDAFELVQNPSPELRKWKTIMRKVIDSDRAVLERLDLLHTFYENYINHIWEMDSKGNMKRIPTVRGLSKTYVNAKKRTVPSFLHGMADGLSPKSLDPLELNEIRQKHTSLVIANKSFLDGLAGLDIDGLPALATKDYVEKNGLQEFYERVPDHPALSYFKYIGGDKKEKVNLNNIGEFTANNGQNYVYVGVETKTKERTYFTTQTYYAHKAISKDLANVYKASVWREYDGLRAYMRLNNFYKRAKLSFSGFHHIALGMNNVFMGGKYIGNPLPFDLLGWKSTNKTGLKMIKSINPVLWNGLRQGLTLNETGSRADYHKLEDALGNAWGKMEKTPQKFPGISLLGDFKTWFDRGLWERYYAGSKAGAYMVRYGIALKEFAKDFPTEYTEWARQGYPVLGETVYEKLCAKIIARDLNNLYGGLPIDMMGISAGAWDTLRALILAPDWQISNWQSSINMMRHLFPEAYREFIIEGETIKGKAPKVSGKAKGAKLTRDAFKTVLKGTLTLMILSELINLWNTKDDKGGSKSMLQNPPGYRNLTKIFEHDGRDYYMDIGRHYFEPYKLFKYTDFSLDAPDNILSIGYSAAKYLESKSSAGLRTAKEAWTMKDWRGRRFADWAHLKEGKLTMSKYINERYAGNPVPGLAVQQALNMTPIWADQGMRAYLGDEPGLVSGFAVFGIHVKVGPENPEIGLILDQLGPLIYKNQLGTITIQERLLMKALGHRLKMIQPERQAEAKAKKEQKEQRIRKNSGLK